MGLEWVYGAPRCTAHLGGSSVLEVLFVFGGQDLLCRCCLQISDDDFFFFVCLFFTRGTKLCYFFIIFRLLDPGPLISRISPLVLSSSTLFSKIPVTC